MRNRKYSYYLQVLIIISLFLTTFSSCQFEELSDNCDKKGLIILNLGIDGLNTTRAAGDQLFTGDEAITKIRVFVFVGDALEVNKLYTIGESQFNNPVVLEVTTGLKDVYVVANESGALATNLTSVSSKSQLMNIMAGQISSPLSLPLVMTGSEFGVNVIEQVEPTRNIINITLTRAAAKVSLQFKKDTESDVTITKISLLNNTENMPIWIAGATTTNPAYWNWSYSLPLPLTLSSTATSVSGYDEIYLYENLAGLLNKSNATQLEVEAMYDGILTKYRVYLNEETDTPGEPGEPISSDVDINDHLYKIKRNYHYRLIGTISGLGEYTTISVNVKILPWTVHEYAEPLE